MRINIGFLALGVVAMAGGTVFGQAERADSARKKILFFSPSFGFRHSTVTRPTTGELSYAEKVLQKMADKAGYELHVSQDFNDLSNDDQYKQYDAIIFYTTGTPPINRNSLLKYIREGGAFIGIHPATDTFHSDGGCGKAWPAYVKMIGGSFRTHGSQQEVAFKIEDPSHPAAAVIPADWRVKDEIYQFNNFSRDNVKVLLSIDTEKLSDEVLKGLQMKRGGDYPVSWVREEGKGRVFYTSLGHREDVWTNPIWQKHVLAGIEWAMGASK